MCFSERNNGRILILVTLVFIACNLLANNSAMLAANHGLANDQATVSKQFKAGISHSEFGAAAEKIGIDCLLETGRDPRCWITDVRPGSIAFYKGLIKGDRILSLIKCGKGFEITVERKGKIYHLYLESMAKPGIAVDLTAQKAQLKSQVGVDLLKSEIDKNNLQIGTSKQGIRTANEQKATDLKKIAQYQLELIIDRSGSMDWQDGTGDLSKFQWCEKQTIALARALEAYAPDLTITVFNPDFQTFKNVKPAKVHEIYQHYQPEGGTDLVDPLKARIGEYLRTRTSKSKPLLIAVITDGLPNIPENPDAVLDYLVTASQEMHRPEEITVTFLQIGDTFEGQEFLRKLAYDAISAGAKYDYIDTRTFDQLKSSGLISALIAAISHEEKKGLPATAFAPSQQYHVKHTPLPHEATEKLSSLDNQLKDAADERSQLEKTILQGK